MRFLSVDPLMSSYPMLTPYQYASNNPILNIDLDGLEGDISILASDISNGLPEIRVPSGDLVELLVEQGYSVILQPLDGKANNNCFKIFGKRNSCVNRW